MKTGKNRTLDGLPMKLLVNLRILAEEGEWFEGELHPQALDVGEDDFLRIAGPIRYPLAACAAAARRTSKRTSRSRTSSPRSRTKARTIFWT
jgi:hypothetical protein